MTSILMTGQAMEGRAATTRIAWIAEDRDTVRLLRAPLLAGLVAQRHKVLVLAPNLTSADRLALLAHGVESESFVLPKRRRLPFAFMSGQRHLANTLRAWNARAVVTDGGAVMGFGLRAALMAGITQLYPLCPSGADNSQSLLPETQHALKTATCAFVSSAEEARLIERRFGQRGLPLLKALPLTSIDLVATRSVPLPTLDGGFVFRAVGGAEPGLFGAAAALLDGRSGKARFELLDGAELNPSTGLMAGSSTFDFFDEDSRTAALSSAHVVVVDGASARHHCALATALSLGRPVLAIENVLTRDLIDSGVNGWLVPRDAAALAEAMTAILKRPDLLPGMAHAARRKAERRFARSAVNIALLDALGLGARVAQVA
jgi:hypothetical protein